MLPKTMERVRRHTKPALNQRIRSQTESNFKKYAQRNEGEINRRLEKLDGEWDIERTLEANAASFVLLGLFLSRFSRKWLMLPAAVAGFLLQHALQGWCPPIPVFRRLGKRTEREIEKERYGLKILRGDFDEVAREKNGYRRSWKILKAVER